MDKTNQKTEKEIVANPAPNFINSIAEEVAKTLAQRLPGMFIKGPQKKKKVKRKNLPKLDNPIFLDTSAIIDARIFEIVKLHVFTGTFVVLETVLWELKHVADMQDMVKRERGRRGLEGLEKIKKERGIRFMVLDGEVLKEIQKKNKEVDEQLIAITKKYKGKLITCDYNLEKKASIAGLKVINVHAMAQALKVTAVPGESLHVLILHIGKDPTQGIAYLDDGTMIVVENGSLDINSMVNVVVSRVLATNSGKIFFAKKI